MKPHHEASAAGSTPPLWLVVELSALSALVFWPLGFYQPFFPLWLSAQGFGPDSIGVVMAVPTLLRVLLSPTLSGLADRHIPPRKLLVLYALCACVGWVSVAQGHDFAVLLALVSVATILMMALLPLCEVMTLDGVRLHAGLRYGRVRVWGSLSFMVATLLGGYGIQISSAQIVPYGLAFLCGLTAVFGLRMRSGLSLPGRVETATQRQAPPLPGRLYCLLCGMAAIHASYAVLNGFGPVLWIGQGFAASDIGWLTATSVIAEVYVFIKISAATSPRQARLFMICGAVAGIVRWSAMAVAETVGAVAALQLLHGLTYGLFHLGGLAMVTHFAPVERRARAQGLMSAANGLIYALTMFGAGSLVQHWGLGAYAMMAPCVALGLGLILVACRGVGGPRTH